MTKKLTRTGNSYALILDKPLLDQLHIDADTPLEISTDGKLILVAPVRDKKREAKLKTASDAVFKRYADVFKRLAE